MVGTDALSGLEFYCYPSDELRGRVGAGKQMSPGPRLSGRSRDACPSNGLANELTAVEVAGWITNQRLGCNIPSTGTNKRDVSSIRSQDTPQ